MKPHRIGVSVLATRRRASVAAQSAIGCEPLLDDLLITAVLRIAGVRINILAEEKLLMCPFRVPHKLPLRKNPGGVGLHACGTGKGRQIEQVEYLSCDRTLRIPENEGRPELSRRL